MVWSILSALKNASMNTSILKKCLDELNKDTFRKDYVIGMLETMIDMQDTPVNATKMLTRDEACIEVLKNGFTTHYTAEQPKDEAAILDAKARSRIALVQSMNSEPNV